MEELGRFLRLLIPHINDFGQKSQFDGCILLVKRFQGGTFPQKDKSPPNDEINTLAKFMKI